MTPQEILEFNLHRHEYDADFDRQGILPIYQCSEKSKDCEKKTGGRGALTADQLGRLMCPCQQDHSEILSTDEYQTAVRLRHWYKNSPIDEIAYHTITKKAADWKTFLEPYVGEYVKLLRYDRTLVIYIPCLGHEIVVTGEYRSTTGKIYTIRQLLKETKEKDRINWINTLHETYRFSNLSEEERIDRLVEEFNQSRTKVYSKFFPTKYMTENKE